MKASTRFWVRAVAASTVFFATWAAAMLGGYQPYLVAEGGMAAPVVGIILASSADWSRRLGAVGIFMLIYVLGETAAHLMGLDPSAIGRTLGPSASAVAGALYQTFRIGLPIVAIVVYSRGRLANLWEG